MIHDNIPWDELKAAEDDCLICGRKFPSMDGPGYRSIGTIGNRYSVEVWLIYTVIFAVVVVRILLDAFGLLEWGEE